MKRSDAGTVSAGVRAALGMGRLESLSPHVSAHRRALSAFRGLEPATRLNVVKAILMGAAGLLGYWGFHTTTEAGTDPWQASSIWNNLFRTAQLLTAQFPNNLPTELPIQLQIARFAMPIFAVWFTATAFIRRFDRPLLVWLAGLSRDHIVLIGSSDVSLALARAYRRLGRKVVAIVPSVKGDAADPMEQAGARVLPGDPAQLNVLRRAAVHRAAAVIAVDDAGTASVAFASAVAATNAARRPEDEPLTFLVRLAHRELRSLVATQIASAMRHNRVNLKLYVRERTIARGLLARYPADWGSPPGDGDIHAVVVGLGDMGIELLLQLARIAVPAPGRRTILTVLDRDAEGLKEQVLLENPGLAHCAELRFLNVDIRPSAMTADDAGKWLLSPVPATAIYVTCGDDHANLSMALGLRHAYAAAGAASVPLFVHQRAGADLVDALPQIHAAVFDTLRVVPFGDIEQEADPFYLVDEEIDELARLIHEDYLESRKRSGNISPSPAAVPWSELPDTYRGADRSQADHMQLKLRLLGLHAVSGGACDVDFDTARLETLAVLEHDRWCRDRWMGGWSYAEKRDDQRLLHTDLVPYERLSEPVRDFDRQTIRGLPGLLGQHDIALKRDCRIGIWFSARSAGAKGPALADIVARVLELVGRQADAHLQLVLPLRAPAEFALAAALARDASVGVDVALVRTSAASVDIGREFDRRQVRDLIAASDRAFTLTPSEESGGSVLASVCDWVVTIGDTIDAVAGNSGR